MISSSTESSREKQYFPKDFIFFIAYICLGIFTFYSSDYEKILAKLKEISASTIVVTMAGAFLTTFLLSLFILISYYAIPGFIIRLSCWIAILLLFALGAISILGNPIVAIITILIGVFFLYKYLSTPSYIINGSAKILKGSVSLMLSNLFSICLLEIFISGIMAIPLFTLNLEGMNNEETKNNLTILILSILFIFWTGFLNIYFLKMFAGSLMVSQVRHKKSSTTFAIQNTLFSIGSLCLASLIIALVKLLSYLVDSYEKKRKEESKRNQESSVFSTIILFILKITLYFLYDIIKNINFLAIPYMACTNTSFNDAVLESSVIYRSNLDIASALSFVSISIGMFSIIFFVIFGWTAFAFSAPLIGFLMKNLGIVESQKKVLISPFILAIALFISIMDCISSVACTGLYLYVTEPEETYTGSKHMFKGFQQIRLSQK